MDKQKLYCYVDETGQDTKGELFLVAIVLKEIGQLESLEKKLEDIEQNVFLRLSDAMAGFLREVYQKHEYAVELMKKFKEGRVVVEA